MTKIAIIGGTGLTNMPGLTVHHREMVKTEYGAPSSPLIHGELGNRQVIFLARHGRRHTIPPHLVNYRANLLALSEVGVTHVIALAAVGGISDNCEDRTIVIPDQIIDYTHDRAHTFYGVKNDSFKHIDFSHPYSPVIRERLIAACNAASVKFVGEGVYGATQGPRLETAAEIRRMEQDGCTIVGMTGMPEAALARELDMQYACCAMVVNRAAGKVETGINFSQTENNLKESVELIRGVLEETLKLEF
ncbi:MAG: S-methyl-5'-thioinosine phosphorylase [Pseudomonadota bacterium]